MAKEKQIIVGIYEAGWEQIELVLREGTGGEFYFIPEEGINKVPRIKIGADHDKWQMIFEVYLHEIDEYVMSKMGLRYRPSNNISNNHDDYVFQMTHTQFAEKNARVAEFICDSAYDLNKVWKVWKKSKKN